MGAQPTVEGDVGTRQCCCHENGKSLHFVSLPSKAKLSRESDSLWKDDDESGRGSELQGADEAVMQRIASVFRREKVLATDDQKLQAIIHLQRVFRGRHARSRVTRMHLDNRLPHQLEQDCLEHYGDRYIIAQNLPDNDNNWDSSDPQWRGRASMSKRHRFLIRRDLHWRWFNTLVFGLVDKRGKVNDTAACREAAIRELEDMRSAALHFVDNVRSIDPEWSTSVGLFFHVYGHNSVNSLHLHIVDLSKFGPSYMAMIYKNISVQAVIDGLRQEADDIVSGCLPSASLKEPEFPLNNDAFKKAMLGLNPSVNDAASFRKARESLWELGGPAALRKALVLSGFLRGDNEMLTTGMKPFNVFARLAFQEKLNDSLVGAVSDRYETQHFS